MDFVHSIYVLIETGSSYNDLGKINNINKHKNKDMIKLPDHDNE